VTCAETGKTFRVERRGGTFNYSITKNGQTWEILSIEGSDIRARRALKARGEKFDGYLSNDSRHLTGWRGNILGDVVSCKPFVAWAGSGRGQYCELVRVRDVHGGLWYGRGNGGSPITLRPMKG
jgi:hypothetical protein